MGLLDWLRRRTPASASEPEEQQVVTHVPALSDPILLLMENPAFVAILEEVPSWQVVHARSFGEFSAAVPQRKYAMLPTHRCSALEIVKPTRRLCIR